MPVGSFGGLIQMLLDYDSFNETYMKLERFPRYTKKVPFHFNLSTLHGGHEESCFHTICKKATRKAVVSRDSFFSSLEPYISENFHEVIHIWNDYDQTIIEEFLPEFKSDIVIEEKAERPL